MLPLESIELLQRWERTYPVADWVVRGLRMWPLLRVRLGERLNASSSTADAFLAASRGRRLRHAKMILNQVKTLQAHARDREHAAKPRLPAEAVFLSHPASRRRVGDSWYDAFCDPIADELERAGLRSLMLEAAPYPAQYRLPRHRASLLIEPHMLRATTEGAVLSALPFSGAQARLEGYAALRAEVAKACGADLLMPPSTLHKRALQIQRLAAYFAKIFERTRPKLAMTVCYYTESGMAFSLAARRAGILSVDLQHGVIHSHPAYAGWSALPDDGFELVPDMFWCWTERDAAVIHDWPARQRTRHRSIVGGQPWSCFWLEAHDAAASSIRRRADALRAASHGQATVLVTLQWDLGLTPLIKELIARAPAGFRFWLRLHHVMNAEQAAHIAAWARAHAPDRCVVDEPTELPLPLLLLHTDVHVTRHSTVVQEAGAAGVASVVLDPLALELYAFEVGVGLVTLATEPDQVIAAIETRAAARKLRAATPALGTPQTLRAALHALQRQSRDAPHAP